MNIPPPSSSFIPKLGALLFTWVYLTKHTASHLWTWKPKLPSPSPPQIPPTARWVLWFQQSIRIPIHSTPFGTGNLWPVGCIRLNDAFYSMYLNGQLQIEIRLFYLYVKYINVNNRISFYRENLLCFRSVREYKLLSHVFLSYKSLNTGLLSVSTQALIIL
jgi:hypothetical protein